MSTPHLDRPPATRARLTRPRDDRLIAGVAAGIGRHLGVDPVLVRLAFVVLALTGGAGLVAYVLAWILVPEEGPADGEALDARRSASGAPVLLGWTLIAAGGLVLADRLLPGSPWRLTGPLLLIALGVLLLTPRTGGRP